MSRISLSTLPALIVLRLPAVILRLGGKSTILLLLTISILPLPPLTDFNPTKSSTACNSTRWLIGEEAIHPAIKRSFRLSASPIRQLSPLTNGPHAKVNTGTFMLPSLVLRIARRSALRTEEHRESSSRSRTPSSLILNLSSTPTGEMSLSPRAMLLSELSHSSFSLPSLPSPFDIK